MSQYGVAAAPAAPQNFMPHFDLNEDTRTFMLLDAADYQYDFSFLNLWRVIEPTNMEKHQWYEEVKMDLGTPLTAEFAEAATTFTVATAKAKLFAPYRVININGEQLVVESVDYTNGEVTVTGRGHAGTADTTHASGSTVKVVGVSLPEGVQGTNYKPGDRIPRENFHQEFIHDIEVTERAMLYEHKDRADLIAEEITRVQWKHIIEMSATILNGRGAFDANRGQHTMKGIKQLIEESNGINQGTLGYSNGSFGKTHYKGLMREFMNRNSNVTVITCNALTKQFFTDLLSDSYQVQTGAAIQSGTTGEHYDAVIATGWDGRRIVFNISNQMDDAEALFTDPNKLYIKPTADVDGSGYLMKTVLPNGSEADNVKDTGVYRRNLKSIFTTEVMWADRLAHLTNLFS